MFKYLVVALLCLGTGLSGFCEIPRKVKVPGFEVEAPLAYVCAGDIHLLLQDYELALADFERAEYCMEHFGDFNSVYEFLILFGKTVAYDNLQLRDRCEHSLQSLILTLQALEKEDDENDEEEDDDTDEEFESFWEETIDMVRDMAKLSPSDDIREVLLSIIDEMED